MENRSVLHVALRAPRDVVINNDGVNVIPEVWAVKDKIKEFSDTFRSGSWVNFQSQLNQCDEWIWILLLRSCSSSWRKQWRTRILAASEAIGKDVTGCSPRHGRAQVKGIEKVYLKHLLCDLLVLDTSSWPRLYHCPRMERLRAAWWKIHKFNPWQFASGCCHHRFLLCGYSKSHMKLLYDCCGYMKLLLKSAIKFQSSNKFQFFKRIMTK